MRFIATLLILPLALPELACRKLMGRDVFFGGQSELLSLFPGKLGIYLRAAYYHLTLSSSQASVCINFGTVITHSTAQLGPNVYIGAHCRIGSATIGEHSMLADYVQLLSGARQHGVASGAVPYQYQEQHFSQIVLGRNCWLGAGSIVMSDVGENSIIAAGAVVNRPVPPNSLAAGVPAVVKRSLAPEDASSR